jgi:hypothetical protein
VSGVAAYPDPTYIYFRTFDKEGIPGHISPGMLFIAPAARKSGIQLTGNTAKGTNPPCPRYYYKPLTCNDKTNFTGSIPDFPEIAGKND